MNLSEESIREGEDDTGEADVKKFIGFGYLEENPASKLKAEEVESWREKFENLKGIEIRVTDSAKRVDSPREGWFTFYELSLLSKMRFPLLELASKFHHYDGIVDRTIDAKHLKSVVWDFGIRGSSQDRAVGGGSSLPLLIEAKFLVQVTVHLGTEEEKQNIF